MIALLCVLVGVLGLILAAAVVLAVRTLRQLDEPAPAGVLDRLVRESVAVTLKSGAAFRGVLWETDGRLLVLRNAVGLAGVDGVVVETPADGDVLLFVADVDYVQKP